MGPQCWRNNNKRELCSVSRTLLLRNRLCVDRVLVGDFSNPKSHEFSIPAKVKINPNFTGSPEYHNDVAVLKLSKSVSSSRILPMCTESYSNYSIAVCGMGRTEWNDPKTPTQLQETEEEEKSRCDPYNPYFINKTQVCLAPIKGKSYSGLCFGDSGGPVYPLSPSSGQPICVYGIPSYGQGHCDGVTLCTRVSAYRNWIDQQMQ